MREIKEFSLSIYFEELNRKQEKQIDQPRSARRSSDAVSATALLSVLKALKESEENMLPLTLLAKASGLKIGICETAVDHLEKEGLIAVEPDEETGNDMILLTQKGFESL